VVHTCNHSYSGGRNQGQSRQKVSKVPSSSNKLLWWHMFVIPDNMEVEVGRIVVQGLPEQQVYKTTSQ
jgi:hypothetical protein